MQKARNMLSRAKGSERFARNSKIGDVSSRCLVGRGTIDIDLLLLFWSALIVGSSSAIAHFADTCRGCKSVVRTVFERQPLVLLDAANHDVLSRLAVKNSRFPPSIKGVLLTLACF